MSEHYATIGWQRAPHALDGKPYSRNHTAMLNGQQPVNVSASVEFKGDPESSDLEQLLVSTVASMPHADLSRDCRIPRLSR